MKNFKIDTNRLDKIEAEIYDLILKGTTDPNRIKKQFPNRASLNTVKNVLKSSQLMKLNKEDEAEITTRTITRDTEITYILSYEGSKKKISLKIDGKKGVIGKKSSLSIQLHGSRYNIKLKVVAQEPGKKWKLTMHKIVLNDHERTLKPIEGAAGTCDLVKSTKRK